MVYCSEDQWGEDELKRTLDDIDELYKKYLWLRELGRGYMIQNISNDHFSFLPGPEQT